MSMAVSSDSEMPLSEAQVTQPTETADIVIVGAGISGLSLAFRLHQRLANWKVFILEASRRPGGTIWTEYDQGFMLEYGPNGFLTTKTSTLALIRDLGLEAELVSANPIAKYRYVYDGHQLHLLPTGLFSLVKFPLLPWRSKWALLTEYWRRSQPPSSEESVYDFIARRTDQLAARLLGELLVTGIYAGDPTQLSMAACFPRIVAMERETGSVTAGFFRAAKQRKAQARQEGRPHLRGSQLYSLRRGLRQLIDTLAQRLQPSLRLGTGACAISYVPDRQGYNWKIVTAQALYLCRQLVLTCPAYVQTELLRNLDSQLANLIAGIPYVPIAVIALGYKSSQVLRTLNGFGYLTTSHSRSPMLGAQWCSHIFPERAPHDRVLMRYLAGGVRAPGILEYRDEQLVRWAHQEACGLFGIHGDPDYIRVIRWPRAIPQYVLGHPERLNNIQSVLEKYPGLYLAGNAYYGVSLNDCTERSQVLSEQIARFAAKCISFHAQ